MTLIAKNLRAIRKHHKLTQDQFANKLGIKRSSVGAYEEGRAEPPIINLSNISKTFEVSIDSLIQEDLELSLGINPITGQKQSANSKIGGVQLKVLAITVNKENKENIEYIPQKAAAGYLNGYSDPYFLEEMPKFHLPNLPVGTYRAFEINGESMTPIRSGSVVIGKYLEQVNDVKNGERYIIISQSEGIVFKRIFEEDDKHLKLVSDNPNFAPYHIKKTEVLEIWKANSLITNNLPEPGKDLNLEKLEKSISEMKKDLQGLKRNLG